MSIEKKTACITGAGGALGSAMVRMLIDAGAAHIIALDKNTAALAPLKSGKVTTIGCDATDSAALEKNLADSFAKHSIDILINNAGILHSAPLVNMLSKEPARFATAAADWKQVIEANLSSVFYVTQLVANHMAKKRTKGVIVNISSVAAQGTAGQSAYAASKAGVNALTQVWAKELGPVGIRCVAVAPGYIDTASTHKALGSAQLKAVIEKVPLKRLGTVENLLSAVRFAIENDYVNGTILEVDGGLVV
jgi:3-oxoacyl-[acyl-carrier protein] reductase